ncbi:MAG: amino acid permease [Ignavibacteria bacterium]|jgi:APA family basic amino acid/polyamine antiporter
MSIKPKLNLLDTTVAVVSLVVGIGIFRTPALVAKETGSPELFFAAWITGGIIALLGGLTFAELGSRKPLAGGFYKLASEAYHPALAFMINWLGVIITSGATYAAVLILGSEYLSALIPIEGINSPFGLKITATCIVIILFIINFLGIKTSATVLNAITISKIGIIIIFSFLAIFISGNNADTPVVPLIQNPSLFSAFSNGLIAVFFTYGGYQLIMILCAGLIEPKRNLKRGIIFGVVTTIIVYLLINFGYYKLLGTEGVANSPLIAADTARIIFGSTGSKIISFVIFISAAGFVNVSLMHLPRIFYAMADDKVIPSVFMKVNDKTQVQEYSLILLTIIILIFIIFQGQFDKLLNIIMFNDNLVIAIVASTIFVFRKRKSDTVEYTGLKVNPIIPAIFILFLLIVSFKAFSQDITSGLISILVLFLGLPIYFILRKTVK